MAKRPWAAHPRLVQIHRQILSERARNRLRQIAAKRKISEDEVLKEAVEILRKLEWRAAREIKGSVPQHTYFGLPQPMDYFHKVIQRQVEKGRIPVLKKGPLYPLAAARTAISQWLIRRRGEGTIPLASYYRNSSAYSDAFVELIDDVMHGRRPSVVLMNAIVHEVLEANKRIRRRKPHITEAYTLDLQIALRLIRQLPKIFPQYYARKRR